MSAPAALRRWLRGERLHASGPAPQRLLVASFAALIAAGTLLLLHPAATPPERPIGVVDALFTATSATCVTGLVVRDTGGEFTLFGQLVILALIQLGGLGIMTLSLVILGVLGGRFSPISRTILAQTLAGAGFWEDFWPLLKLVVRFTFTVEALGALALFLRWEPELGAARAAYAALFHAVSAFCNAGFSIFPDNLTAWRGDAWVNLVIGSLIVLGGLGYLTVYEVLAWLRRARPLSLHSRLALSVSAVLIAAGAVLIFLLELTYSFASLSWGERLWASLFQSITSRTAGFNTVEIGALAPATLAVIMLLMFIGGSPGSCAGGVKTTTFGVLAVVGWTRLRHRTHVNLFRRTLSPRTVADTLSITLAGLVVVSAGVFLLLALQQLAAGAVQTHALFVEYLFETVSALGTVGLSTGATPTLAPASRVLIIVLMFAGRLGPLTVAAALARRDELGDWRYPEEEVMVG
jgi:trk system potassium uptake protein TrkH